MYLQNPIFQDDDFSDLLASKIINTVTGIGLTQANELVEEVGGIHKLATLTYYDLVTKHKIGDKRAKKILALTKWALLLNDTPHKSQVRVNAPVDLANIYMLEMGLLQKEELRVASLDTRHHLKSVQTLYRGSIDTITIRVCEIFRTPIVQNASGIILLHNHPSGDPTPSLEDVDVTRMICHAGDNLDIKLLDHLVIGKNCYTSLKERNLGGL